MPRTVCGRLAGVARPAPVGLPGVGQPDAPGHPVRRPRQARVQPEDLGVAGRIERLVAEGKARGGAGNQVMPEIPVGDVARPCGEAERALRRRRSGDPGRHEVGTPEAEHAVGENRGHARACVGLALPDGGDAQAARVAVQRAVSARNGDRDRQFQVGQPRLCFPAEHGQDKNAHVPRPGGGAARRARPAGTGQGRPGPNAQRRGHGGHGENPEFHGNTSFSPSGRRPSRNRSAGNSADRPHPHSPSGNPALREARPRDRAHN